MDTETESQEIEASGDAIVIADAIKYLADSIFALARSQEGEVEEKPEITRYLDGTPKV